MKKRTKKIILAVIMLITVLSIFSLNVFADTWIDLPENAPVLSYNSNLGRITYNIPDPYSEERETLVSYNLGTSITTNMTEDRTQSFNGSIETYELRNTENDDTYKILYNGSFTQSTGVTSTGAKSKVKYIKYSNLRHSWNDIMAMREFTWHMDDIYIDRDNRNYVPMFTFKDEVISNGELKLTYNITYQREIIDYKTGKVSTALATWKKTYDKVTSPVKIVPDDFKPVNLTTTARNGSVNGAALDGYKIVFAEVKVESLPEELIAFDNINFTEYISVNRTDAQGKEISPIINSVMYDKALARNTRVVIEVVDFEVDSFWNFIKTAVGGFFDFELIPNISVSEIIGFFLVIIIMIIALKVFAGG